MPFAGSPFDGSGCRPPRFGASSATPPATEARTAGPAARSWTCRLGLAEFIRDPGPELSQVGPLTSLN